MKKCRRCGESKSLSEYYKQKQHKDGLGSWCKSCDKSRMKKYRDHRPYTAKRKAYAKEYNIIHRVVKRNNEIKKKYGLNDYQVKDLYAQQNGKCCICDKDLVWEGHKTNSVFIDHDHKTGQVRGLLCHYHNTGLGLFQDNIEYLKNAIRYLEKSKKT